MELWSGVKVWSDLSRLSLDNLVKDWSDLSRLNLDNARSSPGHILFYTKKININFGKGG